MKKTEIIKQIQETIKQLSSDPKEADTIKALQKQILNMSKCKHGKYTNKFFGKECKPCGSPKTVICKIKADGRTSHSSKNCNPVNCKFFATKINEADVRQPRATFAKESLNIKVSFTTRLLK